MSHVERALAVVFSCAAVLGCTTVTRLGSHDAAPSVDAAESTPCGPTTCDPGTICCNASCGICTTPGMTCIDIPCTDGGGSSCGGDDATLTSEGACSTTLYRWTGTDCEALMGCTCSGRDCERLRSTAADCYEEHSECWLHDCRTDGSIPCRAGHFCEVLACTDSSGSCARSPAACTDVLEPVVCGCDGRPYAGTCAARQSAVSHDGSEDCGLCEPAVATIAGGCSLALGYVWDGGQCALVRGCSCTGECDRLYTTLADCTTSRAPCLTFACGSLRCRRWDEVCVQAPAGERCDPLPGVCEGVPSCTCILDVATCTESAPGAYVVTPL